MFLKIFRGTGPGVVFLIFVVALLVWLIPLTQPQYSASFHYDVHPMPLYSLLSAAVGSNPLIAVSVSFLLVLIISILIVSFNTAVFFINERTFLPGLIYILFSGLFPHFQTLNPVLPAALFLIIALRRIMASYRRGGVSINFFDAGILISVGALFYANLIWFGLVVFIGIAILRTGNIREIFYAVVGLCIPVAITVGILYATGRDISSFFEDLRYNLFAETGDYYLSRVVIAGLFIAGLSLLICLFYLISSMSTKKIKSRKTFTELIWILIISATIFFVLPSTSVEIIYIAAIPASYLFAHYFVMNKKKMIPGIIFTALFVVVAVFQVWRLF